MVIADVVAALAIVSVPLAHWLGTLTARARPHRGLPVAGGVRLLRRRGLRRPPGDRRSGADRRGERGHLGRGLLPRPRRPDGDRRPPRLRRPRRAARGRRAVVRAVGGVRLHDPDPAVAGPVRAPSAAAAGARLGGRRGTALPVGPRGGALADGDRLPAVAVGCGVHVAVGAVRRPAARGRDERAEVRAALRGVGHRRDARRRDDAVAAAAAVPEPADAALAAGGRGDRDRRDDDLVVDRRRRRDGRVGRVVPGRHPQLDDVPPAGDARAAPGAGQHRRPDALVRGRLDVRGARGERLAGWVGLRVALVSVVAVGLLAAVFGWLSPLRRMDGRPGSPVPAGAGHRSD